MYKSSGSSPPFIINFKKDGGNSGRGYWSLIAERHTRAYSCNISLAAVKTSVFDGHVGHPFNPYKSQNIEQELCIPCPHDCINPLSINNG